MWLENKKRYYAISCLQGFDGVCAVRLIRFATKRRRRNNFNAGFGRVLGGIGRTDRLGRDCGRADSFQFRPFFPALRACAPVCACGARVCFETFAPVTV